MRKDYKEEKKKILNSPAGDDINSECAKGLKPCKYNKFNECIWCGNRKGHKFHKQKTIVLKKK